MKLDINKIYILHHPVLKDRKEDFLKQLEIFNIENEIEWVESFGPNEYKGVVSNIKPSEISLYLKHTYVYEQINNNVNNINTLILEDDCLFNKETFDVFNVIIEEFNNKNGDLCFIGKCCNIQPPTIINGVYLYASPSFTTRCTHAYVINKKCVPAILKNISFVNNPIDFKLNEIILKEELLSCYTEPAFLQNKKYESTIQKQ